MNVLEAKGLRKAYESEGVAVPADLTFGNVGGA